MMRPICHAAWLGLLLACSRADFQPPEPLGSLLGGNPEGLGFGGDGGMSGPSDAFLEAVDPPGTGDANGSGGGVPFSGNVPPGSSAAPSDGDDPPIAPAPFPAFQWPWFNETNGSVPVLPFPECLPWPWSAGDNSSDPIFNGTAPWPWPWSWDDQPDPNATFPFNGTWPWASSNNASWPWDPFNGTSPLRPWPCLNCTSPPLNSTWPWPWWMANQTAGNSTAPPATGTWPWPWWGPNQTVGNSTAPFNGHWRRHRQRWFWCPNSTGSIPQPDPSSDAGDGDFATGNDPYNAFGPNGQNSSWGENSTTNPGNETDTSGGESDSTDVPPADSSEGNSSWVNTTQGDDDDSEDEGAPESSQDADVPGQSHKFQRTEANHVPRSSHACDRDFVKDFLLRGLIGYLAPSNCRDP